MIFRTRDPRCPSSRDGSQWPDVTAISRWEQRVLARVPRAIAPAHRRRQVPPATGQWYWKTLTYAGTDGWPLPSARTYSLGEHTDHENFRTLSRCSSSLPRRHRCERLPHDDLKQRYHDKGGTMYVTYLWLGHLRNLSHARGMGTAQEGARSPDLCDLLNRYHSRDQQSAVGLLAIDLDNLVLRYKRLDQSDASLADIIPHPTETRSERSTLHRLVHRQERQGWRRPE